MVRKHTAANIAFSEKPVRMADVGREAAVGICHAGVGTVESLVTAGQAAPAAAAAPRADDDRKTHRGDGCGPGGGSTR
jgi:hypothetical protein